MFAFTTLTVRVEGAGVALTFTRNEMPDVDLVVPHGVPFKLALDEKELPFVVPVVDALKHDGEAS